MPVGRPKNRGGDAEFTSECPVFGTARSPVELTAKQGRRLIVDHAETEQMNVRIRYMTFATPVPEDRMRPNIKPCAACGARLYLEGQAPDDGAVAAVGRVPAPPLAERSRSPRAG